MRRAPLAQRVDVVVGAAGAGGAASETALHAHLVGALEHEHRTHARLAGHHARPPAQVVLVAREAVHEERVLTCAPHP